MTPFLVLTFALAGWWAGEPPSLRSRDPLSELPRIDDNEHLEHVRRSIAIMESNIELIEGVMKELPHLYTPSERASRYRDLDEMREQVRFMRTREQVLEWAAQQRKMNPGPATKREVLDRLEKLIKEEDAWKAAWKK